MNFLTLKQSGRKSRIKSYRPLSSLTPFTWFIFLNGLFILRATFLACLWLKIFFKIHFWSSFYYLLVSLSCGFTNLMVTLCFSSQKFHFQNFTCYVQPSTLARWLRLRQKHPYLWVQKQAWTSLNLEPLIRVLSDWSTGYIVRIGRHFTILHPPFAEMGIKAHRKKGICPKWNWGSQSQEKNWPGSWSVLWIIVIAELTVEISFKD